MNAMTRISKELVEQHWPLTNVKIGPILQRSGERVVGKVESAQGAFVYKIADRFKNLENLPQYLSVFDFLHRANFPHVAHILRTSSGENFSVVEGSLIYLIEFIEGSPPEISPEDMYQLGAVAGRLHNIEGA